MVHIPAASLTAERKAIMHSDIDELLDLEQFERRLPELAAEYAAAKPYPHIVLDGVLRPETLERAYREFDDLDLTHWNNYLHVNERKYSNTAVATWGDTLAELSAAFTSERFTTFLSQLTGFANLRPDPSLDGGGLHRSLPGGFLNIHADFTAHHTHANWQRRVNLLLYLNREWQPEWGGDLELWDRDMRECVSTVAPVGNRILLFTTDEHSYHGHPEPLRCPDGMARQSMALYYFTEEVKPVVKATNYRARPTDGFRKVLIFLDTQALRAYDKVKRRLGISDKVVSRVLGKLGGRRRKAR